MELKNGETYNGVLINCDNYMNISLKDAILTSKVRLELIDKNRMEIYSGN